MFYDIAPYVVGAAISPLLLLTTILFLAQPYKPRMQTFFYFLGALGVTVIFGGLIFFAMHGRHASIKPGSGDSTIHLLTGLTLIGLSVKFWQSKDKKVKPRKKVRLDRSFGVGIALMATNFTAFAMFIPAAVELRAASEAEKTLALIVLSVSALLPIWMPLVADLVLGRKSQNLLNPLSEFMQRYGHQCSAALVALIGVYVIYKGALGI